MSVMGKYPQASGHIVYNDFFNILISKLILHFLFPKLGALFKVWDHGSIAPLNPD